MAGILIIVLGLLLGLASSGLILWGTQQLNSEENRRLSEQYALALEEIEEITRLRGLEQMVATQEIVTTERDTALVIQELSKPERYFLSFTVQHPAGMSSQQSLRMLKALAEKFKPPFSMEPKDNPFSLIFSDLANKGLIAPTEGVIKLTPWGERVVATMQKARVEPFDFPVASDNGKDKR